MLAKEAAQPVLDGVVLHRLVRLTSFRVAGYRLEAVPCYKNLQRVTVQLAT
jgi:hypothetical protein